MMEDQVQALTIVDPVASTVEVTIPPISIGEAANRVAKQRLLKEYQDKKSEETLRRQKADIALFEKFLASAGQKVEGMAYDLAAWGIVSWGLVEAFNRWQLNEEYKTTSINVRLSTIKVYCRMAAKAEYLTTQEYALIKAVEGISGKEASHVDEKRIKAGIATRRSTKKARATPLKPEHVELLKQQPDTFEGRRDRLIICLLFDHALRCGEVALLNVQDIDLDPALQTGMLYITSEKTEGITGDKHKAKLTPDTYEAARNYLILLPITPGPLFVGKISRERINERSIYHRVRLLGRRIGLKLDLSPHDGRHFFADDALNPENENSLAAIQQAGRWKSPAMVMRYATEKKVINEGLNLTATRKREA